MNRDLTSKRTPLRNSCFVNTPFRSPIDVGLTSKTDRVLSKSADPSELRKSKIETTTPKRPHSIDENCLIKKRRIEIEKKKTPTDFENFQPTRLDLSALKRRIRSKKQEIESIKIKLSYQKKHKAQEVNTEIVKWRNACHKALIQFQKDWNQNNSEGISLGMEEIMTMLNLPPKVVKISDDFQD